VANAWAFAAQNRIKGQTFSKRVRKEGKAEGRFVEITGAHSPAYSSGIVIEKGDIKEHSPLGMSGKEIRAVMEGTGILP
jgi:hypothetical protein